MTTVPVPMQIITSRIVAAPTIKPTKEIIITCYNNEYMQHISNYGIFYIYYIFLTLFFVPLA